MSLNHIREDTVSTVSGAIAHSARLMFHDKIRLQIHADKKCWKSRISSDSFLNRTSTMDSEANVEPSFIDRSFRPLEELVHVTHRCVKKRDHVGGPRAFSSLEILYG